MSLAGLAEKEAGNQAFKDGDYEKALHYYGLAIDLNPNDAAFYSNRSATLHKLGRFQRAADDAMRCIELKPEWPKGFFRLGEAYYAKGLFAKASDAYSTALDLEPNDVGVREALARAQKALYTKTVEEAEQEKAKPANLARYDSDDEDRPAIEPTLGRSLSLGASASERHQEIMNRRLANSTGISSLEDYMRYRNSGGAGAATPGGPAPRAGTTPHADPSARAQFMSSMGISDGSPDAKPRSHSADVPSGPSGGFNASSGSSASQRSDLAKQRAEFLASLSRTGAVKADDAGAGGGWAKISASDRLAAAAALSSQGSDRTDTWQPSSVSTTKSDGSSPAGQPRGQTPPMYGRRAATPPQELPGSAFALPPAGLAAAPRRGPPRAGADVAEEAVDTQSLATVAVLGASVSANHPLFAGLQTKAKMRVGGGSDDDGSPMGPSANKKHESLGNGEEISRGWLQEFRAKKEAGHQVKAVGDEKVAQLKQAYGDFHYRKYKETSADDEHTRKVIVSNAITAEALAGYEFDKMR